MEIGHTSKDLFIFKGQKQRKLPAWMEMYQIREKKLQEPSRKIMKTQKFQQDNQSLNSPG